MFKELWYSEEEKTIRGGFINLLISVIYIILIITGSLVSWIASNLREMETLLIGFFIASFGLWTGKKSVEFIKNNSITSMLSKHGLSFDDILSGEAKESLRQTRSSSTGVRVETNRQKKEREDEKEDLR